MCDIREATVVRSAYDGCSKFSYERVVGQCAYVFWTCNPKGFSQDKINSTV